ncbi:MAG: Stk1 family PASTA domain-containing Ser/Thr kinase [Candidatus Ancillula sp.]|jgi:serine/threonine-protein kinase|nr:Stk1 family PASTA domain-containing Ser/Thr kinase [Candidatus Ancillula sp.]
MSNITLLQDGHYRLGGLIGQGGMADVYIGDDTKLNRKVAIKILKPQFADDPVFLARFRREAQSVGGLNNANIVAVYDTGEEIYTDASGKNVHQPYIVMEYVDGKSLRDILATEGRLSVEDSVEITTNILKALSYSHRAGIIHRDIKPGNIMITTSGEVKVMDFGIARAMSDNSATMTQSQSVVGTAQYISPEQAKGEAVDARSDLYSVGCLFFELLAGRPPFVGDSPVSIAYQHVREFPPKVVSLNTAVPPVYDVILSKVLAKDPEKRYSDAGQFIIDLESAIKGLPVSPSVDDVATRVLTPNEVNQIAGQDLQATQLFTQVDGADAQETSEEQALEEALDEENAKKKKMIIIGSIIAGVVVLLLIIFLVVFNMAPHDDPNAKVTVPTISKSMAKDKACQTLNDIGLTCSLVDDKDSAEEKDKLTGQDPAPGVEVPKGSTVTLKYSTGPADSTIPKTIVAKSFDDAKKALETAGYIVSVKKADDARTVDCVNPGTLSSPEEVTLNEGACQTDKSQVAGTKPAVGTSAKKGSTVTLYLSSGVATIPNLVGQTKDAAKKILDSMGLKMAEGGEEINDQIPSGSVVTQTPAGNVTAQTKSTVTIKTAKAQDKVQVPGNLVNQTKDFANGQLSALGFAVSIVEGSTTSDKNLENKVESVDHSGEQVVKGSTVTVKIWKYVNPDSILGACKFKEDGQDVTTQNVSESACKAKSGYISWTKN